MKLWRAGRTFSTFVEDDAGFSGPDPFVQRSDAMPPKVVRCVRRYASAGRSVAWVASALVACAAMAQPKPGDGPPNGHGGPPAEALAACKMLKAQDACEFTGARGAASGKCWAPEGRPLACRPNEGPHGSGNGSPPANRPKP